MKFLIVEDDQLSALVLSKILSTFGQVEHAISTRQALEKASLKSFDIILIDLDLESELAGLTLLKDLKNVNCYKVIISGRDNSSIIRTAYENGCRDYLVKPYKGKSVEMVVQRYLLMKRKERVQSQLMQRYITLDQSIWEQIGQVAFGLVSDRPVMITGESGTGKTQLAKILHEVAFESGPFIHLNCSELSESLLESELFGHVKGAFTGAVKSKKGVLELANGGTLFLDEVATMPHSLQKKLLKAIEEKYFFKVGGEEIVESNFRIITATCEDLKEKIKKTEFREDLYYRLEGFNIHLTPLRERGEDIPLLINELQKSFDRRLVFNEDAWEYLMNYAWPGNIRELKKFIDLLHAKNVGLVHVSDLPEKITANQLGPTQKIFDELHFDFVKKYGLSRYVEKIEEDVLRISLNENDHKVRRTLEDLQISTNAFYRIKERIDGKRDSL